jgi:hypothetical protein
VKNLKSKPREQVLVIYSTSQLTKTDLVKFFYALKGRDQKPGFLTRIKAEFLAKGAFLAEKRHLTEIKEFFELWTCSIKIKNLTEQKNAAKALFSYSTHHLSKKDLVKFFYALKGRDGKSGVLQNTKSTFITKGVILTPLAQATELEDFFDAWGCKTIRRYIASNVH